MRCRLLIGLAISLTLTCCLVNASCALADDAGACTRANGDERIDACTRIILSNKSSDSNLAWAYRNRGLGWRSKGDDERAIADYNEAIRIDPNLALAYLNRGWSWHLKHDEDRAIADFTTSIKLDPKIALAYEDRAAAYFASKNYDRALSDYNDATRLDPSYIDPYIGRGNVYRNKRDYDRALSEYNEALRRNPNSITAYVGRGNVNLDRKDYDRAIADYSDAIRLDPKYALAYGNRGNVYSDKRDYDRALSDYNDAIRIDPNFAIALRSRGNVYRDRKDYDRALSDYNDAIKADPQYSAAYSSRGAIYAAKKDFDRALADYNEAIRIDPKNAVAFYNRGSFYFDKQDFDRALADLGENDRATADLNQALRLDPTLGYARTALANIKPRPNAGQPSTSQPLTSQAATNSSLSLRRVALIISNSDYAAYGVLPNPKHDGELIASVLRAVGFQSVVLKTNLARDQMLKALQEFAALADNADWSVVYYSGHGVDARLIADRDIDIEAVDVGKLSSVMAGSSKLRLIILDMCRSNPFIKRMKRTIASRGVGRGLAPPPEDDAGEYTAFAARDGQEALDGTGNNSPFAEALARRVKPEIIQSFQRGMSALSHFCPNYFQKLPDHRDC